jgi:hypothetical protein
MARAVAEVPLEDFEESINILVHAWPGQGKTVWATGAPEPQLVSAEPGAISAKRQGRRGVGLIRIKSWSDANDWLIQLEAGKFDHRKWAIIDTISNIQQKNQNSVLDKAVADNPRRDPDIPAIQDYQKQQNSLKRWVERVVDYPINTIFIAHTMDVEDKDGGRRLMPTILGGADKGFPIANYVMGLMNAVGYMEMRSVKTEEGQKMVRRILWQPYHDNKRDIRYIAKDQFDCFGTFTDDLDFAGHLALIEGSGVGEESEATQEETPKPVRRKRAA